MIKPFKNKGLERNALFWKLISCENWSKTGEIKTGTQKSLEYSPNGKYFLVKDATNTFIIFNSKNAKELKRVKGNLIQFITFNTNSEIIAIGRKGNSVLLWDNI